LLRIDAAANISRRSPISIKAVRPIQLELGMTLRLKIVRHFAIALTALSVAGPLLAQQRVFTAADYDRGARFLVQNMSGLVVGGTVQANWLPDERYTYRNQTADGGQFFVVDPARKARAIAFDHAKIAAALSAAAGQTYTARQLPFQQVDLSAKSDSIGFDLNNRRWSCDVVGTKCATSAKRAAAWWCGGRARRSAAAGAARWATRRFRRTAAKPLSFATGTSGCATWRVVRRNSSPRTA
jgi:hypothetical protein